MLVKYSQNVRESFWYMELLLIWIFIIIPHHSFGNSINVEAAYGAKSKSLEVDRRNRLLADVFHKDFGVDLDSANGLVTNISTAFARFAVDFIAHSGDWDGDDYLAADIKNTQWMTFNNKNALFEMQALQS